MGSTDESALMLAITSISVKFYEWIAKYIIEGSQIYYKNYNSKQTLQAVLKFINKM